MFASWGALVYRRRRWILVIGLVLVVAAGAWGAGVIKELSPGGYDDPGSESAQAARVIADRLDVPSADAVVLYSSGEHTVGQPAFRSAVTGSLEDLPPGLVTSARTYYTTHAPQLVSTDRHATYAVLTLAGDDAKAKDAAYEQVRDALHAPGLTVRYGGFVPFNAEIEDQVSADLQRAETLSLPILLVLLVLIFGSLAAASLPLAVGGFAILGAFSVLRLFALGTDVSVFALNLVTMVGLGLAVDYALFIVSRFREELAGGLPVPDALAETMATAGRTVAFSGLTVAVSLSSLLLFPQVFLRSMGLGGIATVLVDVLAALTILPALLAVLGHRVSALRVPWPWRRRHREGHGAWYRVAHSVMRRPVAYVAVLVVVLLAMGAPFLHARFGGVDTSALPASSAGRQVAETLRTDFPGNATSPIDVVVEGTTDRAALRAYAGRLGEVDGVTGTRVAAVSGDTALVEVGYTGEPLGERAQDLVRAVRAVPGPAGARVLVGGQSAALVDLLHSVGERLPWMAALVASAMFVLLFLAFGSVVLPIKAIVMNVLSLGASFGAITWIFQDGHLTGLLNFTPPGAIDATDPILMLAVIFGLSMDYEVFLLSRIREQWDLTHDNADAVATGLQRSGQIITSAALLLVVVIGAFSTSQIVFLKLLGVGTVIAIVVDATVVRALLVPATMRLLGRLNWWAPGPLSRWWDRHGLREAPVAPEPEPVSVPAGR